MDGLLVAAAEKGICRVVCFSPRHDLTLAKMSAAELRAVVDVWIEQYRSLGAEPSINSVVIFENRGAMMGASNPHPHGQIWANAALPNEPAKEQASFLAYRRQHESCFLCEYWKIERKRAERLVIENDQFAAIVPFWAVWPFETLVISKRSLAAWTNSWNPNATRWRTSSASCNAGLRQPVRNFVPILHGISPAPHRRRAASRVAFPRAFLSAAAALRHMRKFMVGYELLGSPQRDITPEEAAGRLREVVTRT